MLIATSSRNPTKLREKFDAGSIAVCRMGNKVALHIDTPDGLILVHMREIDFVRGCRGPADHNRVPFRTIQEIDVDLRMAKEAASLPPPSVHSANEAKSRPRQKITGDKLKLYEQVATIASGPRVRGAVSAACRVRGIDAGSFRFWWRRQKGKAA